jgi:hypothetical protein
MRCTHWSDVLYANIEIWRPKRFDWATWSCCHLLAHHLRDTIGIDYLPRFPAFSTRDEAWSILASLGGIEQLISSELGEPVPIAFAKRGDPVVGNFGQTDLDEGLVAGVCLGIQSCAPGARGLVFMPTAETTMAWRI